MEIHLELLGLLMGWQIFLHPKPALVLEVEALCSIRSVEGFYVILDDGDLADRYRIEGIFDPLRSITDVVGRDFIEHLEFSNTSH